MKTQFFKINLFGKATYERNRTPKSINVELARAENIPGSLDEFKALAIETLKKYRVKSGIVSIGAFQSEEDGEMIFVHLMPKTQLNVLSGVFNA